MSKNSDRECFVLSVTHTQRHTPYIMLWGGGNSGYRGRVETAGRYTEGDILGNLGYYNNGDDAVAVPCKLMEGVAKPVEPGFFDDDHGRWVANTRKNWLEILRHVIRAPANEPEPKYRGARKKNDE
ncbi:hypothetical protein [Serratia sp. CC22-02]|uniref:hypothetical protein n=1 Tax=Serratia sp. CC22-02 TaxID=1378076 RepID=UPI0024B6C92D|nr:hypothetical protein [Serratia sp. CC22-02]